MPSLLANPGFEDGPTGWQQLPSAAYAAIAEDATLARTGSWLAQLTVAQAGIGGPWQRGEIRQSVPVLHDVVYRASCWVQRIDPGVRVELSRGSSVLASANSGDGWQQLSALSSEPSGIWVYRIRAVEDPSAGKWLVDDCALDIAMPSRRDTLRQALLSALAGIDGTGNYESAPREVLSYAKIPTAGLTPAIYIASWTEEREPAGYQRSTAVLSFDVRCYSSAELVETRITEMEQMLADVERAIGADVTLGHASWGVQATISSVTMTPAVEGQPLGYVGIQVDVPYRFSRGAP